jgi:hypothetical protein
MGLDEDDRRRVDSGTREIMNAFELMLARHVNGCPAMQSQGRLDKVYKELFNGDDGEHGFVAEHRKFQLDITNKVSFVHGAAKAWSIIFAVLLSACMSFFVWAFHEVYPAFRQIMADYYTHHPEAKIPQQKSIVEPNEVYTVRMNSSTQQAGKDW